MSLATVMGPGGCRLNGVLLDDPAGALEEVGPNSHAAPPDDVHLRRSDERQRPRAVR